MQIFVNCMGETRCLQLENHSSLEQLKSRVQSEFGVEVPVELFSGSNRLDALEGLVSDSTVFAMLDVLGGGKKRGGKKRKAYATPKKNKHKHVNVKLQALNYYAIKGDGSVERTRKLCEQETCKGKGIMMANHWNRYYCGNCALTLLKKDAPKEEPKKQKVAQAKVVEEVKVDDKKKGKKK
jgi:small subunit ribosomal protein S27Ae